MHTELCDIHMHENEIDLDEELVRRALLETGAKSKTELIEMGLRALLEREARKRLKALFGQVHSSNPAAGRS